jgi:hypothetical protein
MGDSDVLSRLSALEGSISSLRSDLDRLSSQFDAQAKSIQALDAKTDRSFRTVADQQHVFIEVQSQQATYIEKSVRKLKSRQRDIGLELQQLKNTVKAIQQAPAPPPKVSASAGDPARLHLEFDAEAPLSGIIAFLTAKHSQNVHDSGEVIISADAPYDDDPDYAPKNAADLADVNSRFFSACGSNQSITYEFKRALVRPTQYVIRSGQFGCDLKEWVIEGSIDGTEWKILDVREDNDDLEGESAVGTFEINNPEEVRFVRLRQTGKAHDGSNQITITAFELFGDLQEIQ